jgi:hypothetical protein
MQQTSGEAAAIARKRELAGQHTALEIASTPDLVNRPISIEVEADLPDGARAVRRMIVELTGSKANPYLVRAYE